MNADVQIIEGGKRIRTEKMKLRLVKEFSDIVIYENQDGKAVMFSRKKNEYILISVDMA